MVRTQIRQNQVWFFYPGKDGIQTNGIIEHYNVHADSWAITMGGNLKIKLTVTLANGEAFHAAVRRDNPTINEILMEEAKQAIEAAIREFKIRAFPQLGPHIGQGTVVLQGYP